MKRWIVVFSIVAAIMVACNPVVMFQEEVPPGYVGMVMQPGGFTGTVLQPGKHTAYGRDKLVIIETRELVSNMPLSILCQDDLNFKFNLALRTRLRATDGKSVTQLLNKQGSLIKWHRGSLGELPFSSVVQTYVSQVADATTRGIVSKYQTMQIRESRQEITKAIHEELSKALEGTPVELMLVALNNFDYPDIITRAMEIKKQREVEIQQEKAEQAKKLLQMENRLKLAQKSKEVRVTEAEAEAASNLILGKSITPQFLEIRRLENQKLLYEQIGPNDKFFLGADAMPLINIPVSK